MTRRDDAVLLRDMLDASHIAMEEIRGCAPEDLLADKVRLLGLVKCLEIIGEAASNLSAEFRAQHDEVPWGLIVGMRHRLVQAYFDIDDQQIWKALTEDLPRLSAQLQPVLNRIDRPGNTNQ